MRGCQCYELFLSFSGKQWDLYELQWYCIQRINVVFHVAKMEKESCLNRVVQAAIFCKVVGGSRQMS